MTDFEDLDLNELLADIKPNVLTPRLDEIVSVTNQKKPRVIADILVKYMHSTLTNPVTKDVAHKGSIHKIKYFDIEPLISGSWPMISLMLLQLPYGEQTTIIESIYPDNIQLTAKAFAINFTPDITTTNIKIENDTELIDKLDSTNAGIATLIAMVRKLGTSVTHPDLIRKELDYMETLVKDDREARDFAEQTKRAQEAMKYRDGDSR